MALFKFFPDERHGRFQNWFGYRGSKPVGRVVNEVGSKVFKVYTPAAESQAAAHWPFAGEARSLKAAETYLRELAH